MKNLIEIDIVLNTLPASVSGISHVLAVYGRSLSVNSIKM